MQWGTPVSHILLTRELFGGIGRTVSITCSRGGQRSWITLTLVPDSRLKVKVRMTQPVLSSPVIRFEVFEVDLQGGELRKRGRRVKLQEQPFRVLALLLERSGEVVSREELRQTLWPVDTFVDFDHGLNSAVARLRETLNDSASQPRFIETIPRQGYRFIAPLELPAVPEPSPPNARLETPSSRGRWVAAGATLLVLLCGIGVWWFVQERADASLPPVEVVPLVGLPGYEAGPAFSPDGNQVAFLQFGGQENTGIYTTVVGGEKSLRLTKNLNDCCVTWSPDGREVAFLRFSEKNFDVDEIPALGGTERRLYTAPRPLWATLSWTPDGKTLAFPETSPNSYRSWIALLTPGSSTTRPLTSPPGEARDAGAVFSPDGSKVAFIRGTIAGVVNDLYVVPASGGEPKRLTFDNQPMFGVTWSSDGHDIVFSSQRGGQDSLWRVSASGGVPQQVPGAGSAAYSPSVSPKGNMMVYQQKMGKDNIWRIRLKDEKHAQGVPAVVVSAKGGKLRPDFSPDGKKIAFESDRLGNMEIWACDSDGQNCAQLTSLHGTAGRASWSPDGRHIAFEFHPTEHAEIYVLDVPGGIPRMVSTIPGADNLVPSWSRDGKWIYFTSKPGSGPFQLWRAPFEGGAPVQITTAGGLAAAESADGQFLYYSKYEADGIWRMPLRGGQEERVLDRPAGNDWFNWGLARNGIYFLDRSVEPKSTVNFFELATRKITQISSLDKPTGWGLALAPDGRSLLYVEVDFEESNIMLVKNFR